MNCYANTTQLTSALAPETTTDTTRLLFCLIVASRQIDEYCGRQFYTSKESRYFDVDRLNRINISDLLSATEVAYDYELNGSYSQVADTDEYFLYPANGYPKTSIDLPVDRAVALPIIGTRACKITGTWGYGDNTASPWKSSGLTITVATTTATAVTASASGFVAGQTIRAGTEDMFIEAATTTALTVVRGVNGSTAQIHSGVAAYIAQYPYSITNACITKAIDTWRLAKTAGLRSQTIGSYSVSYQDHTKMSDLDMRLLSPFVRHGS